MLAHSPLDREWWKPALATAGTSDGSVDPFNRHSSSFETCLLVARLASSASFFPSWPGDAPLKLSVFRYDRKLVAVRTWGRR